MVTEKKPTIKFTLLPSKAWWLFLGVVILGIAVMLLAPKKSSQPLLMYLPQNTTFYYHWSDLATYKSLDISKLAIIDTTEPTTKIEELKKLLLDGFFSAKEIVWFKTESLSDDNFLLRLDNAKQVTKWLATNRPEYSYLLIDNDILLVSADPWLTNHYNEQSRMEVASNNISLGINIFWSKKNAPEFLSALTEWLKLDTGLPNIYANIYQQKDGQLNIHVWQVKLRQVINASSTDVWPNKANFPLGADLVFGFGEHAPDKWQAVVSQSILQPLFGELPYYRLSAKKIEEQILKNNYIYLANDKWLMVGSEDWQSRINDWVPNLNLQETKNRLPDGTVYTEYISGQEAVIEKLSYQAKDYWYFGELYGAQIDSSYYLSNSESIIQATLVSKYDMQSYLGQCQLAGDYQIIDLVQVNSAKIKDETIKKALLDKKINNLTVFSYENNQQIGFRACFR
ncbi:MAG: hypothetical protein WCV69_01975 [Patescibacteria group bacterium]